MKHDNKFIRLERGERGNMGRYALRMYVAKDIEGSLASFVKALQFERDQINSS